MHKTQDMLLSLSTSRGNANQLDVQLSKLCFNLISLSVFALSNVLHYGLVVV